ncbi:hypothetical protein BDR03DRAFT_944433 [Suillus americanus]|nr:hypothetical protein BDR03DRAFT_944433 [Suillus americanus]
MSAHLAEQLRGRVVCLAFSATAEITQLTGCSQRNVETPPRFRTESDTQEIHLLVAVAGQPTVRSLFLDEIQEQLLETQNIEVSIAILAHDSAVSVHCIVKEDSESLQTSVRIEGDFSQGLYKTIRSV